MAPMATHALGGDRRGRRCAVHRRRPRLAAQFIIGGHTSGTVMRHFLSRVPVAVLTRGVGTTAPQRALVAASGRALRLAPGRARTARTAVDIAPVTATAQHHLAPAAGTVEPPGGVLHRRLPPMRTGWKTRLGGYLSTGRAVHGLRGAASERLWRSGPVPRLSQRPCRFKPYALVCQRPGPRNHIPPTAWYAAPLLARVHYPRWRPSAISAIYARVWTATNRR